MNNPVAKTQTFKINNTPEIIIKKIIERYGSRISSGVVSLKKEKNRYQKAHTDIRGFILKNNPARGIPNYTFFQTEDGSKFRFFYISEDGNPKDIEALVELHKNELDKFCKAILNIAINISYFDYAGELYNYPNSLLNDKMYLCSDTMSVDDKYLKVFEPEFNYSATEGLFSFDVSARAFLNGNNQSTKEKDLKNYSEANILYINENSKTKIRKIDARTSHTAKFIDFGAKYNQTRNYFQNLIYQITTKMFDELKLEYIPVTFTADDIKFDFIDFEAQSDKSVVLINNGVDDKLAKDISEIMLPVISKYTNKEALLVKLEDFNIDSHKDDYLIFMNGIAGIVMSDEKELPSTLHADQYLKKNPGVKADFYTDFKIKNIFQNNKKYLTNGININPDTLKNKKDAGKIYHAVKKILIELNLKNMILRDKYIPTTGLEFDGKLSVYYSKNVGTIKKPANYIAYSSISISDNQMNILDTKIFTSKAHFLVSFNGAQDIANKILNNSETFCMVDQDGNSILRYRTDFTPIIIGNNEFCTIGYFNDHGKLIRSYRDSNPLPYYITGYVKKQKYKTFTERNGDDILYFVSGNLPINKNIDKQNLIYTISSYNVDGCKVDASKSDLVNLYLKTLTFDALNINESSKTSILEKIGREILGGY